MVHAGGYHPEDPELHAKFMWYEMVKVCFLSLITT